MMQAIAVFDAINYFSLDWIIIVARHHAYGIFAVEVSASPRAL